jgi:hypothetical protein
MTVLNYLSEGDRNGLSYKSLRRDFEAYDFNLIENAQDFLDFIRTSNFENNHIAILAHGGPNGLYSDNQGSNHVSWSQLIDNIEARENEDSFILNLTSICNGNFIRDYYDEVPVNIDEIWVTENTTMQLSASLSLFSHGFHTAHMLEGNYTRLYE